MQVKYDQKSHEFTISGLDVDQVNKIRWALNHAVEHNKSMTLYETVSKKELKQWQEFKDQLENETQLCRDSIFEGFLIESVKKR